MESHRDTAGTAPVPPWWKEPRLLLLVFLAVQLAAKLALLAQYAERDPFFAHAFADAGVYDSWSERILAGEPYGPRAYYQAPLYPFLLAGLKLATGGSLAGVLVLQLLAGTAALALLAAAGTRLAGAWAGLCAALLTGLHAPVVFHELKLLPAVWVLLADAAVVLLALRALERRTVPSALLAGVAAGLLVVLYPARLLLVGLAAAAFALGRRSIPFRRRALLSAVALAGVAAPLLPVALRNRAADGGFVLVSSSLGDTLYQGNNRLATGSLAGTPELPADISRQEAASRSAAEKALGRPATSAEASRLWAARAAAWARGEPAAFLRLLGRKVLLSFSGLDYADNFSFAFERERFLPLLRLFFVPWTLLLGLFLLAVLLPGRRPALGGVLLLLAANQTVCVVFYFSTRYRLPSVPWVALGAALLVTTPPARDAWRRAAAWMAAGVVASAVVALVAWEAHVAPTLPTDAFSAAAADGFATSGRYAEARQQMEEAVAASPEPRRLLKLAQIAYLAGDADGAERALARRMAAAPADLEALDLSGRLAWARGRLPEAEEALRRALALDPSSRFHAVKLAEAVARQGRVEEALRLLDRALSRWPSDPEARRLRGELESPAAGAAPRAPGSAPSPPPAR